MALRPEVFLPYYADTGEGSFASFGKGLMKGYERAKGFQQEREKLDLLKAKKDKADADALAETTKESIFDVIRGMLSSNPEDLTADNIKGMFETSEALNKIDLPDSIENMILRDIDPDTGVLRTDSLNRLAGSLPEDPRIEQRKLAIQESVEKRQMAPKLTNVMLKGQENPSVLYKQPTGAYSYDLEGKRTVSPDAITQTLGKHQFDEPGALSQSQDSKARREMGEAVASTISFVEGITEAKNMVEANPGAYKAPGEASLLYSNLQDVFSNVINVALNDGKGRSFDDIRKRNKTFIRENASDNAQFNALAEQLAYSRAKLVDSKVTDADFQSFYKQIVTKSQDPEVFLKNADKIAKRAYAQTRNRIDFSPDFTGKQDLLGQYKSRYEKYYPPQKSATAKKTGLSPLQEWYEKNQMGYESE